MGWAVRSLSKPSRSLLNRKHKIDIVEELRLLPGDLVDQTSALENLQYVRPAVPMLGGLVKSRISPSSRALISQLEVPKKGSVLPSGIE